MVLLSGGTSSGSFTLQEVDLVLESISCVRFVSLSHDVEYPNWRF